MKREPQAKEPRRPRPIKPAAWLEEVKPDEDVMAVFYGKPAAAPAATESEPVSRETDNRSPGLLRETSDSQSLPTGLPRETDSSPSGLPQTGLPVNPEPVSRLSRDVAAGEAHWPSRRFKARVQTRIPQSLNEDLTSYCERRGVTRDAAVERAIRLLLAEDSDNRSPGLPDFGLPVSRETGSQQHDHDIDHDGLIIQIYERETGRRFRAEDRPLVAEFRGLDLSIIETAIRHAVKYAREPVGSFAYCAKVIRQRATKATAPPPAAVERPAMSTEPEVPELARYEIRQAAARLKEANRDRLAYDHDRLVADLRSSFVALGREVTTEEIEQALEGLAL